MTRSPSVAAIIACALLAAAGCATPPAPSPQAAPARPVPVAALPGFEADALDGLGSAIVRQCTLRTPPGPWPALGAEFAALPRPAPAAMPVPAAIRGWIVARFEAWPLRDARGGADGLVTGYFEPLLTGSRTRESARQAPLYARPADLLTIDLAGVEPRLAGLRLRGRLQGSRVVPFHSRADIETAAPLAGSELLWVDDRIDAFFLEIQGSGRVRLRDGTMQRVGYADQNGHPYRAIGRTLIERGALKAEEVSAPAIRRWLRDNPAQAAEVMRSNPSVVFFRELPPAPPAPPGEPEAGPPGSLGVPLTAMRSLAVDRSTACRCAARWPRRTPAARSPAASAPTSSGASARPPSARPARCARAEGCGCCGRRARRRRRPRRSEAPSARERLQDVIIFSVIVLSA
jgi:membrane-bound lytic murein transglycosylase A